MLDEIDCDFRRRNVPAYIPAVRIAFTVGRGWIDGEPMSAK